MKIAQGFDIQLREHQAAMAALLHDTSLQKNMQAIRRLRLEQGELLYRLHRKFQGFNKGDPGYSEAAALLMKPLYQYLDDGIWETWSQFCEDPARPSRMTAHKLMTIYECYSVQANINYSALIECSTERLYSAARRAAESGAIDWQENIVANASTLTDTDWEVWLHTTFGARRESSVGKNTVVPLVLYDTVEALRQMGIDVDTYPDRVMRVTVEPANQKATPPPDEIRAILNMCERVLRGLLAGDPPDMKQVTAIVKTLDAMKAVEAL